MSLELLSEELQVKCTNFVPKIEVQDNLRIVWIFAPKHYFLSINVCELHFGAFLQQKLVGKYVGEAS